MKVQLLVKLDDGTMVEGMPVEDDSTESIKSIVEGVSDYKRGSLTVESVDPRGWVIVPRERIVYAQVRTVNGG